MRHIGEVAARQRGDRSLLMVVVIDGGLSLLRREQRQKDANQRRLACSRLAKDSRETAWAEVVGKVLDDGATFGIVAIRHVVETDAHIAFHLDGGGLFLEWQFFQFYQTLT